MKIVDRKTFLRAFEADMRRIIIQQSEQLFRAVAEEMVDPVKIRTTGWRSWAALLHGSYSREMMMVY